MTRNNQKHIGAQLETNTYMYNSNENIDLCVRGPSEQQLYKFEHIWKSFNTEVGLFRFPKIFTREHRDLE